MPSLKDLNKIVDEAEHMLEEHVRAVMENITDTMPDVRRPSDVEFWQFVQELRQKYPPKSYLSPSGETFYESPAVLLFRHGENTKGEWARLRKLQG